MHVVFVDIHIKPDYRERFIQLTLENCRNSIQEPGIQRFDFYQQGEDPNHFVLVEIYHQPDDQQKHRETKHYRIWKDSVSDMMAEPRVGTKYQNLFPSDEQWS